VCNLYGVTTNQTAIRELTGAMIDHTGNLPPMPAVWPDYEAPIVRNSAQGRELVLARWGMPSPAFALKGRKTDPGVTNIRNTASPHWRRWLGVKHRCVVPFTAFSEMEKLANASHAPVWFGPDRAPDLMVFAGIWTEWTSVRKVKEGEVTADLFGFLTTEPNNLVASVHPKAMPVILTTRDEIDLWLDASAPVALSLQRQLPEDALKITGRGQKSQPA